MRSLCCACSVDFSPLPFFVLSNVNHFGVLRVTPLVVSLNLSLLSFSLLIWGTLMTRRAQEHKSQTNIKSHTKKNNTTRSQFGTQRKPTNHNQIHKVSYCSGEKRDSS